MFGQDNEAFTLAEISSNQYQEGSMLGSNESQGESGIDTNCFDPDGEDEVKIRFSGRLCSSFRRRSKKKGLRRSCSDAYDVRANGFRMMVSDAAVPEMTRSQYSLIGEVSPGAMEVWMGLPEEVKYDSALEPFRQHYEKEHGTSGSVQLCPRGVGAKSRIPLVCSAPILNNNLQLLHEQIKFKGENNNNNQINGSTKNEKIFDIEEEEGERRTLIKRAGHITKMFLLLACWVFFTLMFMMYNEKEEITRQTSIAPGLVKDYIINSPAAQLSVHLRLSGPFLAETTEMRLNQSQLLQRPGLEVWLERWTLRNGTDEQPNVADVESFQNSTRWKILLEDEARIDFSEAETRTKTLKVPGNHSTGTGHVVYAIRMNSSSAQALPIRMSYTENPLDSKTGVVYACFLLLGLYVLIIFEVINRTMSAVLVSTTSIAVLSIVGERPSLAELISWLDVETLLLLFSMMVLVAIMAETGMFDYLAVFTFQVTKGKMWPLINLLSAITAVLSTFLDNVTTVLLMTPVTIRLCEEMQLDPVPILMSMVLYSNIGGTATPVGDPPNVIIASNKAVVASGINFTNFTMHMTLGIVLVCLQTYFQLKFIYRDTNKLRLSVPADIQELRRQIAIWQRAANSLPHLSKDEMVVRDRLEKKVKKLTSQMELRVKETTKRACPKETFEKTLSEMKSKYKIRDKPLLVKATIAIAFVVAVFFLHSIPELNRVSLGWTALLGAILLLILADREDLEPVLHRVEWSTLLFFAALFVLMEALSKLGLIDFIGGLTESLILSVSEPARLAVSLMLILWVSGISSAFVDNIPLTTMMVKVATSLGSNPNLNLPMAPLIWALSYGACLGGNGTLIGASANVVCAGVAEQHGYKFSFVRFFKVGFPIMIGHLFVTSAYLLLCHCVFEWH